MKTRKVIFALALTFSTLAFWGCDDELGNIFPTMAVEQQTAATVIGGLKEAERD